jgi:phenylpropionate dioxygenase-like ring-hydroxylating dioxygenase large terminal subunit
MTYIRNAWYMIAWSEEITHAPFSRTVLELPIVLYREPSNNRLIAMLDRCPHRFAPLSLGTIVGSNIRCGYHGLEFDASGRCVRNPFSKAVPTAAKIRTFPIAEKDGSVWIWPGDADAANPENITRLAHQVDPTQRCVHGYTLAKADYRLLSDNLMDLSHTAFLHPRLGGEHYIPKVSSWEEQDGSIVADFVIDGMPNFLGQDELPGEFLRHNDKMRWVAPATHLLTSRASSLDPPGIDWVSDSAHILTPETAQSTHYFWSAAVVGTSSMSDADHLAILRQAFEDQDKPMIEAVQHRMGTHDLWDLNPVLLNCDSGGVRVRRRLAALIKAEAGQAAAQDPRSGANPVTANSALDALAAADTSRGTD